MSDANSKQPEVKKSAGGNQAAKTADYKVLSRLDHDGETYMPGKTVTLTEEQAKPLLGGAIEAS